MSAYFLPLVQGMSDEAEGMRSFSRNLEIANEAWESGSALSELYAIRLQTLAAQQKIVAGNMETMTTLIGAGLSAEYWGEALPTAVLLTNLTPRKGTGKSRYELFTKRVPTAKYLRRFGRLAYVKLQKHGKFEPVSVAGMFIGYSPNRKAYKVAVGGKCVLVSPSVVFDESRNGIDVLRGREAIPAGLQLQPLGGLPALPGQEEVVNLGEGDEYAVQWLACGPNPCGYRGVCGC
jgi:hypothetical protein